MSDPILRFEPHPLIKGGIAQTIVGSQCTGKTDLPERKIHKIRLGPRSVLLVLELPAKTEGHPIVLLAHGMGGCSESGYMKRIAYKLAGQGFGVFMMNHRGSGPGMGMSDTLWNGGCSDDLEQVIEFIIKRYPDRRLLVVGFSLSGNILLKYLGEGRNIPSQISGAFAANPPVDLKVASQCISHGKMAAIFNWYYMDKINNQAEALVECFPDAFHPPLDLNTIYKFDAAYTALAAGYKDVEEYYQKCSSGQFLEFIKVPTTILCAEDDPFIPARVFQNTRMSLSIFYYSAPKGGHLGYISRRNTPLGDRRWMDYFIVDWAQNPHY